MYIRWKLKDFSRKISAQIKSNQQWEEKGWRTSLQIRAIRRRVHLYKFAPYVSPRDFIKEGQRFDYDKEKYNEMLLEAAETVLGYFGFDRTLYGDPPRKNRKWWRELSNWRIQDIENERS